MCGPQPRRCQPQPAATGCVVLTEYARLVHRLWLPSWSLTWKRISLAGCVADSGTKIKCLKKKEGKKKAARLRWALR